LKVRLEPIIDALGVKDMLADWNLADGDLLLEFIEADHTIFLLEFVDVLIIRALSYQFYESFDYLFLFLPSLLFCLLGSCPNVIGNAHYQPDECGYHANYAYDDANYEQDDANGRVNIIFRLINLFRLIKIFLLCLDNETDDLFKPIVLIPYVDFNVFRLILTKITYGNP
jgi:hypothetical protein